jgi:hypothetical protein
MNQGNVKSVAGVVAKKPEGILEDPRAGDRLVGAYRTPQVFAIGRAKDLMRSGSGNARDSRNWYVYP